jgi:Ser/Thr protein kinase RdoA (MazF antagonist)
MPGGDVLGVADNAVECYAELLELLVRLAPAPDTIRPLVPSPPWVAWDHAHSGVWPPPDDRDADLNADSGAAWLDEAGRRVTGRLRQMRGEAHVVGHGDWEAQNLRWRGRQPAAVHDGQRRPIPGFARTGHRRHGVVTRACASTAISSGVIGAVRDGEALGM